MDTYFLLFVKNMADNVLDSGPPSAKRPKLSSPALSVSASDGNGKYLIIFSFQKCSIVMKRNITFSSFASFAVDVWLRFIYSRIKANQSLANLRFSLIVQ